MRCPYCSHMETKVLDSRDVEDSGITRRRRECLKCEKRFTTYERPEIAEVVVKKKDGRREKFDRAKLRNGVMKACEKRPISTEQIEKIVDEIEMELRRREDIEVPSTQIGELVMRHLKKVDKVAYIRFASVYREFEDIETFEEELHRLLKKRKRGK
ncbi:MAG: transcriptional regulator NrdR [Candidatus Micrarchaeota archaeon]|nr:transcriptional regulator NrdR [Candidatus Micrarchaeota archaeon]